MRKSNVTTQKQDNSSETSVGCGCCVSSHPNLDEFFGNAAQESTIHGVKYIGSNKLNTVQRVFWTIITLTSLGAGIYLVCRAYIKYNISPVMISFQSHETPISAIPYPAITICSVNLLKRSVLNSLANEVRDLYAQYLVKNITATASAEELNILENRFWDRAAHLDHLGQSCLLAPSFRRKLNLTLRDAGGNMDVIEQVNKLAQETRGNASKKLEDVQFSSNFGTEDRLLFKKARINCDDLLLNCMWAGSLISCKDLFFPIETRHGHCCVYNMMPKSILQNISTDDPLAVKDREAIPNTTLEEWHNFAKHDLIVTDADKLADIKYPKHQKAGGKQYGLTVLANAGLEEYSTCTANDGWGFKIVAHSPLSFPSIMDYGTAVPKNSEVFVDMDPQVTVDSEVSDIRLEKRGCYLADDPGAKLKNYNYYSAENCFTECWANHTWNECQCIQFFMPGNDSQTLCGAKKRDCAEGVHAMLTRNFGKENACGHCLPPCKEIQYRMQVSHFDIREHNASSFLTFNNSEGNMENVTSYSILHMYLGTDSFYAKQRKKMYDSGTLIANAGGLLSLTLGVSIISFVEVAYLFTIRAWFRFRSTGNSTSTKTEGRKEVVANQIKRRRSSTISPSTNQVDDYYYWALRNRANGRGQPGFKGGNTNILF